MKYMESARVASFTSGRGCTFYLNVARRLVGRGRPRRRHPRGGGGAAPPYGRAHACERGWQRAHHAAKAGISGVSGVGGAASVHGSSSPTRLTEWSAIWRSTLRR